MDPTAINPNPPSVEYLLCIGSIAVAIQTVFGAFLLRAACGLYNKAVGRSPSNRISEPPYDMAMIAVFVTTLINSLGGLALAFVSATVGLFTEANWAVLALLSQLIMVPIGFFVMSSSRLRPVRSNAKLGHARIVVHC